MCPQSSPSGLAAGYPAGRVGCAQRMGFARRERRGVTWRWPFPAAPAGASAPPPAQPPPPSHWNTQAFVASGFSASATQGLTTPALMCRTQNQRCESRVPAV